MDAGTLRLNKIAAADVHSQLPPILYQKRALGAFGVSGVKYTTGMDPGCLPRRNGRLWQMGKTSDQECIINEKLPMT